MEGEVSGMEGSADRDKLLSNLKPVRDLRHSPGQKISDLVKSFSLVGGFTAKKLWVGAEILREMIEDPKSLNFLSFPAAIIATGVRGTIVEMLKRGWFHVVITTCGTLDHDIARSLADYYEGWFEADDAELHRLGIHRLGNVFIPLENYGPAIEAFMKELLLELYSRGVRSLATYELCWEIGRALDRSERREESILWWAWKKKVPVVVPGITDGAVGTQLFLFSQDKDFRIDLMKDEKLLADLVFEAERSGALIIGGGISKHHVIWWNQFKEGLDRAVYITTAVEWDGSLSGARMREAISWGKVKERARYITVEGDATVVLPLIVAYVIDVLSED